MLEHVLCNTGYSGPGSLAGLGRALLQTSLDGIDGRVAQRTHGTRDKTDKGSLPARQGRIGILRLPLLEPLLEVGVGGKVDGLVRALAEGREGDAAVEGAEALLLDDGVEGVRGVSVLGNIHGVRHGVVLGLEADLDDLHGRDDGNGLGHTGGETGNEDALAGDVAGGLVGQHLLVPLKGGEADGHLGHNARQDGAEALVQSKRRFFLDELNTGLDEAAAGGSGLARTARELHSDLDCVCGGELAKQKKALTRARDASLSAFVCSTRDNNRAKRKSYDKTGNKNVPRGWQARASIIPAPPPAIRLTAGVGGFLFSPSRAGIVRKEK